MTVSKNIQGAYVVSDIVKGYLITRTYFYYTKQEAIKAFKTEMKGA